MAGVIGLPTPIVWGTKWLLKHPEILASPLLTFYDYVEDWLSTPEVAWRKVVWRYNRLTPVGTVEDVAQFDMHITNITSGQIDSSWTSGDYAAVENCLAPLNVAIQNLQSNTHTLVERRYYQMAFNPDVPQGERVSHQEDIGQKPWRRFALSGPPAHTVGVNGTGSSTASPDPYQVALSVTFKTATRPHWGRVYIPGVAGPATGTTYGRYAQQTVQDIANAFATCAKQLTLQNFQLVVPATQMDGKFAFGLNAVTEVQVDDVPDVIRRRRPKQAAIRYAGVPS